MSKQPDEEIGSEMEMEMKEEQWVGDASTNLIHTHS
jgi:hypothetical protein